MNNSINSDTLLMQMRALASQAQAKTTETPTVAEEKFSDLLKQSIDKVNADQIDSKKIAEAFQAGDPNIQITELMVASQKANLSFQAMLQVRNKLVSAYQDIMNMQV